MEAAHSDWQTAAIRLGRFGEDKKHSGEDMNANASLLSDTSSVCDLDKSQDVSSGSGNVGNVHGNRNWFAEMEASFMVRMFLTIEFRRG